MLSRPLYASWSGPATVCRRAGSPETIIYLRGNQAPRGSHHGDDVDPAVAGLHQIEIIVLYAGEDLGVRVGDEVQAGDRFYIFPDRADDFRRQRLIADDAPSEQRVIRAPLKERVYPP